MPAVEQARPDPRRARAVHERNAAVRALDDPVKVARAQRIVAHGLARGVIDPGDVARLVEQAVEQGFGERVADPSACRRVSALLGGGDDHA